MQYDAIVILHTFLVFTVFFFLIGSESDPELESELEEDSELELVLSEDDSVTFFFFFFLAFFSKVLVKLLRYAVLSIYILIVKIMVIGSHWQNRVCAVDEIGNYLLCR